MQGQKEIKVWVCVVMDGLYLWVMLEKGILEHVAPNMHDSQGCDCIVTKTGQALSDMTDPGSGNKSTSALVLSKSTTTEAFGLSDG